MKRALFIIGVTAGLFALGCGESNAPSGSAAPGGSGQAKPLADSDLPVSADYEEEAEKKISASNYKTELDALEKEVDSK
jgi:hypothetical protein